MCFFCWNQSPFCSCGPSHHAVSFPLDEPFESKGCTLCPQILQHPYKRCLLNVEWLHGWMNEQQTSPREWPLSLKRKHWSEAKMKEMANETHDNTWYLGSTLLPSWIFVTCVKRNCASTASNWLGREGGAVYTQIHCGWEDSWTPAEE